MKPEDDVRFTELMLILQDLYSKEPLNDRMFKYYFHHFKDWTIEQFDTACYNLIDAKTIKTFPVPGEIRASLTTKREVLEAWDLARKAVHREGADMSIQFENAVLHSVINTMGGWQAFCHLSNDRDIKFAQIEFMKLYPEMKFRTEHPVYLRGNYDNEHNLVRIGKTAKRLPYEEAVQIIKQSRPKSIEDKCVKSLIDGIGDKL